MYKEIAIDPACMADFDYYILLKREFGFNKGRYVAADIKAWAKDAFQFVKNSTIDPVKKKSVKTFLNQVRKGKAKNIFLLTNDRKAITADSWEAWYQAQTDHRPFSVTISKTCTNGHLNHEAILEGCEQWEVPPSISIKRNNPSTIVNAIEPLLYLSKEATLVDQYFRLTHDNKMLIELFKILKSCLVTKLTIVTSMDNPDVKASYIQNFQALNTRSISFTWVKAPAKYFHDRYLLTDIGALRAGQGFMDEVEKGVHADMLNINIISREEAIRTKEETNSFIKKDAAVVELEN